MNTFTKLFVTASIVGSLLLAGCGAAQKDQPTGSQSSGQKAEASGSLAKIKERGKLIVGVKTDFPPFGYTNEKGEPDGFEIALAKRFAKDLLGDESKIELVPVTGPNRVPFLQSDKVDVMIATMSKTDEREKVVDFTNPHFKSSTAVIVKEDSPVKEFKDLAGKKVVVVKGSTGDVLMTKKVPDAELIKLGNNTEALQALKDGRGEAYVQDNVMLYYWSRNNPGFRFLDEQVGPAPWAPAVKEGNTELKEWINQDLEALGKERFMHKLYDQYLKEKLGPELNPDDLVVEGGKM